MSDGHAKNQKVKLDYDFSSRCRNITTEANTLNTKINALHNAL